MAPLGQLRQRVQHLQAVPGCLSGLGGGQPLCQLLPTGIGASACIADVDMKMLLACHEWMHSAWDTRCCVSGEGAGCAVEPGSLLRLQAGGATASRARCSGPTWGQDQPECAEAGGPAQQQTLWRTGASRAKVPGSAAAQALD